MKRSTTRRGALAIVAAAATVATLQGVVTPAAGAATPAKPAAPTVSPVGKIEQQTARAFAASLAGPAWRAQVRAAALGGKDVDLAALTAKATSNAGRQLQAAVAKADKGIAAAKGLGAGVGSLLRLRLGTETMAKELKPGTTPLVAAAVLNNKTQHVVAYDAKGATHTLSVKTAPKQAVYVIDLDVTKANKAGMALLEKAQAADVATPSTVRPMAGYQATKMDSVYLNNDEETWIEGAAEIYSLVSGTGLDGTVRVDPVQMPYLDYDGKWYYPGQLIVNWSNYKYNEADLLMMEDDGDTNYQALATAIMNALLTITDKGTYQPLADAVLAAIPTSWWTNDPDYVDSWYALSTTSSGTLHGAAGNGTMTVEPYFVSAL